MAQGTTKGVPIDIDPLLTADSDLLVASQKATKAYADTKQSALGFTPEDVANKQTDLTASATKYPTVDAVNTGLGTKQNALGYTPLPTAAGTTTGTVLTFVTDRLYGSIATPETGNISVDTTNAEIGVTNVIIHNSGTAPTFTSPFKKLSGSGNYATSQINYIFCMYINSTEIIYSINQRA
jgi:hypothetical protein